MLESKKGYKKGVHVELMATHCLDILTGRLAMGPEHSYIRVTGGLLWWAGWILANEVLCSCVGQWIFQIGHK